MGEKTNWRRSERANSLVNVYHHMTSFRDEMEEEIVADLLADLMHFCSDKKKALLHFHAELDEEKNEGQN